jgi:hypothetical protein
MSPQTNPAPEVVDSLLLPRNLLVKLTSPIGTSIILAAFALYALGMFLAFDRPLSDASRDLFLPIGLISQFVGLMCLIVMLRAWRDGRQIEMLFVFFIVMPLNSMFARVAMLAIQNKPVTLDDLTRASIFFNTQIFSPAMWIFLGGLGVACVAALVVAWRRERAANCARA